MQHATTMFTEGEDGSYLYFAFDGDAYSRDRHGFVIKVSDGCGRDIELELNGKEAVELALALDVALHKAGGLK